MVGVKAGGVQLIDPIVEGFRVECVTAPEAIDAGMADDRLRF